MTRRRKTPGYDYSAADSATSLDELRAVRDEIAEHSSELLTRADDGDQIDKTEVDTATTTLRELDDKIAKAELRLQAFKTHANNMDRTPGGTEHERSYNHGAPTRSRRNADVESVVERSVSDGLLDEKTAERIVRAAGGSESMATYVRTTGSEAYESAFGKVVASDHGHLQLTEAERTAFQNAHSENRSLLESNTGTSLILPYALDPAIQLSSGGSVNPIRQIARSVTTTTTAWRGVTSAGASANWTPEASEVQDNTPTLASPIIPVHKATAWSPFSYELAEDASGNFLIELQRLLLDAVDQLEAAAFATGSGVAQPKGIVTALAAANPSVVVNSVGTESIAPSDFYRVSEALPPRFRPNAQWGLNLSTLNIIRQLESANGSKLFPELENGRLLGKPANEISSLDGSLNAAATETNYVAVYGDWSQYVLVNKLGSVVEVIPQVFGPNGRPTGQRGLLLHVRTGADVLVPNAFRVLNVPTTA